jgi:hypothetical protein
MLLFELTREIKYYMMDSMIQVRGIIRLFALLVVLTLALGLSPGAGAGQGPADGFSVYLPLARKAPNTIYGRVTDDGIGAAGVALDLRFFDGSDWSTLMSTTTSSGGNYQFNDVPALGAGEAYLVRYLNTIDQSRLGAWETRQLTSLTSGGMINLGSFDVADIALTAPIYGYETNLPRQFAWARRPATPSDSYKFYLFDIYDYNPKFTSNPLGYTSSFTLNSLPSGFDHCNPYYWAITVESPDGGRGGSLWGWEVTFYTAASYAGIYGCVTEAGAPKSGVSVSLRRYNSLTDGDVPAGTVSTNASGIFAFTSKPDTGAYEYYYVRFENSGSANQVLLYETDLLGGYEAGSSVHIGDFDIADIVLEGPNGGTVSLPAVFQWMPRPMTATDDYELDLFDNSDNDPYAYWDSLGYTDHFILAALPWGFEPGANYVWNVWVYDPFGGYGVSHDTYGVTFSASGSRAATGEARLTDGLRRTERLRQERIRSGQAGQPRPLMCRHPDYAQLMR